MSTQSSAWYIPGEGKQPVGPFTAEQLTQGLRAGRLDANTICWREGMHQWVPLGQIEPFASAIASAKAPRQAPAGAACSSAPRVGVPPAPSLTRWRDGQRRASRAWIRWAVAGAVAATCILVVGVVLLLQARTSVKPPDAADSDDSASQNWGNPVRVRIIGEDKQVETTFLVGLKDAWYTDYGSSGIRLFPSGEKEEKKTFFVVYYYKNLGPRERSFSLGPNGPFSNEKAEIRTDKGHIFSGFNFGAVQSPALFGLGPEERDVGGWRLKPATKIEDTGESALVFEIPKDEAPAELIVSGSIDLDIRLPQGRFAFRQYSEIFGFLPSASEKAVPGLIAALQSEERDSGSFKVHNNEVRGAALRALARIGPSAKDAVPALTNLLLHDDYMDIREAAAKALGEIGPAAKEAIPALQEAVRVPGPRYGGAYAADLYTAVDQALKKIDKTAASRPTSPPRSIPEPEEPDTSSPERLQPELSTRGPIAEAPSEEATEPKPEAVSGASAPALTNGLIDNNLSVAVARFERHVADRSRQQGIFMRDVDGVDMTLAFRRVGAQSLESREFRIIITDDRGNEYEGLQCLGGPGVLYGGSFSLDGRAQISGTPSNVQQMPVGFTWTGNVKVQMPESAPVVKVELERKLFRGYFQQPDTRRFLMDTTKPTMPDFEFGIPEKLLLSEGTTVDAGRDLRSTIGRLTVEDSFRISRNFGPVRTEEGLSFSVPIEFVNMDYNAHTANVLWLSVQFDNGEVIRSSDEVTPSADLQDRPGELGGVPVFDIPGTSSRTLVLRVDIAARMNAEAGLNVRRVLLYGKDGFRGFVPIPDDARERIRAIAGKGSTRTVDKDTGQVEKPAGDGPLSGTWEASTLRARFRIVDNGKALAVSLIRNDALSEFAGTLTRRADKPGLNLLAGTVDVVFKRDASKKYPIRVTATFDGQDLLRVRCYDWLLWDKHGKKLPPTLFSDSWSRLPAVAP